MGTRKRNAYLRYETVGAMAQELRRAQEALHGVMGMPMDNARWNALAMSTIAHCYQIITWILSEEPWRSVASWPPETNGSNNHENL